MVNVTTLQKGNIVRALIDNPKMYLAKGDLLRVVETGRSRWDQMDYADVVSIKNDKVKIEIMQNFQDFELAV